MSQDLKHQKQPDAIHNARPTHFRLTCFGGTKGGYPYQAALVKKYRAMSNKNIANSSKTISARSTARVQSSIFSSSGNFIFNSLCGLFGVWVINLVKKVRTKPRGRNSEKLVNLQSSSLADWLTIGPLRNSLLRAPKQPAQCSLPASVLNDLVYEGVV